MNLVVSVILSWVNLYNITQSLQDTEMGATDIDEWIEIVAKCQYLPENELKVRFKFSSY